MECDVFINYKTALVTMSQRQSKGRMSLEVGGGWLEIGIVKIICLLSPGREYYKLLQNLMFPRNTALE